MTASLNARPWVAQGRVSCARGALGPSSYGAKTLQPYSLNHDSELATASALRQLAGP